MWHWKLFLPVVDVQSIIILSLPQLSSTASVSLPHSNDIV